MHPIIAQRERLALYLGAWIVIAGMIGGLLGIVAALTWSELVIFLLPLAVVNAFMCLAALYPARAFPIAKTNVARLLLVTLSSSVTTALIWVILGKGWSKLLSTNASYEQIGNIYDDVVAPILFGSGILLFVLALTLHYLLLAFESARDAERKTLSLQLLAREAEMKALKAQIHPHFLFNSLNSVSALIVSDPRKARSMLLRLAEFLRESLRLGSLNRISLEEELAILGDFIAIEGIRLGDRLRFTESIDDNALRCLIPPLLLQPLIENAVNHGVAQMIKGGEITLKASASANTLSINIQNPCDPNRSRKSHSGLGLEIVKSRISTLYGNEAYLTTREVGGTFSAQLYIPYSASTDDSTLSRKNLRNL